MIFCKLFISQGICPPLINPKQYPTTREGHLDLLWVMFQALEIMANTRMSALKVNCRGSDVNLQVQ